MSTLIRTHTHFPTPRDATAPAPAEARGLARDEVRMLVARPDRLVHATFQDLPDHLVPGIWWFSTTRQRSMPPPTGSSSVADPSSCMSPRRWTPANASSSCGPRQMRDVPFWTRSPVTSSDSAAWRLDWSPHTHGSTRRQLVTATGCGAPWYRRGYRPLRPSIGAAGA